MHPPYVDSLTQGMSSHGIRHFDLNFQPEVV